MNYGHEDCLDPAMCTHKLCTSGWGRKYLVMCGHNDQEVRVLDNVHTEKNDEILVCGIPAQSVIVGFI